MVIAGDDHALTHHESFDVVRPQVALVGELELAELSEEERVVSNAEISAAIQESVADANYGKVLGGRGVSSVVVTARC